MQNLPVPWCIFQLLNSIKCVELQKEDQQQDFWLLQYQKLIDSIPNKVVYNSVNIDPQLGHQLLINGVIHYLPLLANVFQQCNGNFGEISDKDLNSAGITNSKDRNEIIKSIQDYYYQQTKLSVDFNEEASAILDPKADSESLKYEEHFVNVNECVICMERSVKFETKEHIEIHN